MQSVITVGNFDGCHRGHQKLVLRANQIKADLQLRSIAVSFSPRPEAFFRGLDRRDRLFTDQQKIRALKELNIDEVVIENFDEEFARKSHRQFYHEELIRRLKASALCVGTDFCFGHERQGNGQWLSEQTKATGVRVDLCPPVLRDGNPISSTRIRQILAEDGDVREAAAMLARPYLVEGFIEKGDQLGRRLGFPTANLGSIEQILPRAGVYFGYVWTAPEGPTAPKVLQVDEASLPAVINIGTRPTLNSANAQQRVEGHILSENITADGLYGRKAGFYFVARLRDEQKFAGLEDLKNQIHKDIARARQMI